MREPKKGRYENHVANSANVPNEKDESFRYIGCQILETG